MSTTNEQSKSAMLFLTDPSYGYYITVRRAEFSDGEEYYTAFAPELPNCLYQAGTQEKAEEGIVDLISHLVPLLIEIGSTPPKPIFAKRPAD